MRLSELSGPFEEATAAGAAGDVMLDRVEGTALASSAVVLDGSLPSQQPARWKMWIGPLALIGTFAVLAYFAKPSAESPDRTARAQAELRRDLRRVSKQSRKMRRQAA